MIQMSSRQVHNTLEFTELITEHRYYKLRSTGSPGLCYWTYFLGELRERDSEAWVIEDRTAGCHNDQPIGQYESTTFTFSDDWSHWIFEPITKAHWTVMWNLGEGRTY